MDSQKESRESRERFERAQGEDGARERRLFAMEALGTAKIMAKGFRSVAVSCPFRDGMEKAARRSNATRRGRGKEK